MSCAQAACESNDDCGFPDTGRYCDKTPGDCAGLGACAASPVDCPPVEEPLCACAGDTYSSECEAARFGQSVAYDGACLPGDIDVDADVDLDDYAQWSDCLAGPGEAAAQGACPPGRATIADLDDDGDIDLADFAALQGAFVGD
jgi:hypothetical protein